MAVTSGAGGGSPLAGIPGLTRTYAPGQREPAFAELTGACTVPAVHLETHDQHMTSDPRVPGMTGRGVMVRRARVVSEPVSDYVRWEHDRLGARGTA